ncbi:TPA: carboxypeptidase regulatory-like domain-containing protein [Salmonella enterica subsp. houtenae]|nr:carboxypeptidase regulatory-like domain-containing protein [Salmonella enterica subsp. houtenae]
MSVVISGILKSPDGAVVAGAQIILTALTTSPDVLSGASASAVTTSAGYYGLTVLPGNYALTVSVRGKSQVYGRVSLDGSETTVTLNMLLRRNLVEVSIPGELLTSFRQIQNNVADDLAAMQQLAADVSGKNDQASRSAKDAENSATAAARSEGNAEKSAASALQSEQNTKLNAQSAEDAAQAAKSSEDNVHESELRTKGYADSARLAAENAAGDVAPAAAEQIRREVRDDADRAGRSAEQASLAADGMKGIRTDAWAARDEAQEHAAMARHDARRASDSATAADTSATNAGLSEHGSAGAATNAGLSEHASAGAATDAGRSATAAGNSETRAKSSEDAAAASAVQAGKSELNAKASETAAARHADDARQAAGSAATDAVAVAVPEAVRQIRADIQGDVTRAEQGATSAAASASSAAISEQHAAQALKEAQDIAKTPGPSAYDIWVSQQPDGTDRSVTAYLAFQKGKAGKSAYDTWAENTSGNKSEQAFLDYLRSGRQIKDPGQIGGYVLARVKIDDEAGRSFFALSGVAEAACMTPVAGICRDGVTTFSPLTRTTPLTGTWQTLNSRNLDYGDAQGVVCLLLRIM